MRSDSEKTMYSVQYLSGTKQDQTLLCLGETRVKTNQMLLPEEQRLF